MTFCSKCDEFIFSNNKHVCLLEWTIYDDDSDPEHECPAIVYATDPEAACIKYAEQGGFELTRSLTDGGELAVSVIGGDGTVRKYFITGEVKMDYRVKGV